MSTILCSFLANERLCKGISQNAFRLYEREETDCCPTKSSKAGESQERRSEFAAMNQKVKHQWNGWNQTHTEISILRQCRECQGHCVLGLEGCHIIRVYVECHHYQLWFLCNHIIKTQSKAFSG